MTREARIYSGVKTVSSINGLGNWTHTCKKMKLDRFLPYIKINSKWTKDFNVRPETIKFLEENIGSKLFDIALTYIYIYLDIISLSKGIKRKNKQMGLHQNKKVFTVKETINKMKR